MTYYVIYQIKFFRKIPKFSEIFYCRTSISSQFFKNGKNRHFSQSREKSLNIYIRKNLYENNISRQPFYFPFTSGINKILQASQIKCK